MTSKLKKNAALFYHRADKLKLPITLVPEARAFSINLGKQKYFFQDLLTPFNNTSSTSIASNRYCLNSLLAGARLPIIKSHSVNTEKLMSDPELKNIVNTFKFPLSIQPTLSLQQDYAPQKVFEISELAHQLACLTKEHLWLTIEENCQYPNDYNVLMFDGRVIAICKINYPSVVGDGTKTLSELIDQANAKRKSLNKNLIDTSAIIDPLCLAEQNISLESVIGAKKSVILNKKIKLYKNIDSKLPEFNLDLFSAAAKILDLRLVSFEINCIDLDKPLKSAGVISSVNSQPDLTLYNTVDNHVVFNKLIDNMLKQLIYKHPVSYLLNIIKIFFKPKMLATR